MWKERIEGCSRVHVPEVGRQRRVPPTIASQEVALPIRRLFLLLPSLPKSTQPSHDNLLHLATLEYDLYNPAPAALDLLNKIQRRRAPVAHLRP